MHADSDPPESAGDCIKIFVRVRPPLSETNKCLAVKSSREIVLTGPNPKVFEFDHVADENTTQNTVFTHVGRQIVESCVEGYNGTIFAYGQTGSGKTYTMLGPGEDNIGNFDHRLRGLIPRSLEYLFDLIKRKQEMHGKQFEFECTANFLEIYNEQIFDLLDQHAIRPLQLRESKTRVFVEGITQRFVASGQEAFRVLSEGWSNRRVASTSMNRESSRSHAVFSLIVEIREHTANITKVRKSVLNLVDLAGSERQKDTNSSGVQLREAGNINRSLSTLGNVILALDKRDSGKDRHVPYRDSKLTFLLRDSLGGNAKTHIIVNVHPNSQFFGETNSTLSFAQRAKEIRNRARVNENTHGDVIQLQNELKRLKAQLARYENDNTPRVTRQSSEHQDVDYSEKFLQAMEFLHGRERIIEAQKSRIEKMKKYHMERSYIIKLRNATIAKLRSEKPYEKDDEIEKLKKELEHVEEQLKHHPDIAAYQCKVTELQVEVDKLKKTGIREKMLQELEKDLEALYSKLLTEHQKEKSTSDDCVFGPDESIITPTSSMAGKAKIIKLEANLKSLNEELEKSKEANLGLESELSTTKSQVQELEKILKITQQDNSVHMRRVNEMHETTLRVITTPKRRMSSVGENGHPLESKISKLDPVPCGNLLDLSIPEESEIPTNARIPSLLDDSLDDIVVHKALQKELQEIKQQVENYRNECAEKDRRLAELRQSECSIKEKMAKSTEALSQLKSQLEILQSEHEKLTNDKNIVDLEVRDLRILLKSSDRDLAEEKKKRENLQASTNQRIEDINSTCSTLKSENESLQNAKETLILEAQTLKDECKNLRLELEFVKQQSEDKAKTLEDRKKECETFNSEIQKLKSALEHEKENCAAMQEHLRGESGRVSEELANIRNENYELEKHISALIEQVSSLKSDIETKDTEIKELKSKRQEDGVVTETLSSQLKELRLLYSTLQCSFETTQVKHVELLVHYDECSKELNEATSSLLEKEHLLAEEKSKLKMAQEKHDFEVDCFQEDITGWNEQYSELETNMKLLKTQLENAKSEVSCLQSELDEKQANHDSLRLKAEAAERDKEDQKHDMEKSLSEVVEKYLEARNRNTQLEDQCKELDKVQQQLIEQHKQELDEMKFAIEKECEEMNESNLLNMEQKYKESIAGENEAIAERDLACIQRDEMKSKIDKLTDELEAKNETLERLVQIDIQRYNELKSAKDELTEARQSKIDAEKELAKAMKDKEDLMQDNSSLAGHQNRLQKIKYLSKLKDQINTLEEDKRKLSHELRRCITMLKRYEPDFTFDRLKKYALSAQDTNHTP